MKMKIEFEDHDEYDDLVKSLVRTAYVLLDEENTSLSDDLLRCVLKLLEGEIIEP